MGKSGEVLTSYDPRTGRILGSVAGTTSEEIANICRRAHQVFESNSVFGPPPGCRRLLLALATELEANGTELIATLDDETALGAARLGSELARTTFQLKAFAEAAGSKEITQSFADAADPLHVPPRTAQRRVNVPIGPVAVFAASNFPLAFGILGGDTASALAAGCPVVVKAHPLQPLSGIAIQGIVGRAVDQSGVDPGWLQIVFGATVDSGVHLVMQPAIAAVGFTGSAEGGRALMAAVSEREVPIPVYAEMGSVNPCYVAPCAARQRAGEIGRGWAGVLAGNAGQYCTKPGIAVVPEASVDAVVAEAILRLEEEKSLPMVGGPLASRYETALESAGRIGGVALHRFGSGLATGYYVDRAVIVASAATFRSYPTLREEIFGPAGVVVSCPDDEMLALAATMPAALATSVFADADDEKWVRSLVEIVGRRVGRVVYNSWPVGLSVGWATVHGGPWPTCSVPASTSVGLTAAWRWLRPVSLERFPPSLWPTSLHRAGG